MAIMAFVGWFLFAIFGIKKFIKYIIFKFVKLILIFKIKGGVGLSALPIDLIKDFYYRP